MFVGSGGHAGSGVSEIVVSDGYVGLGLSSVVMTGGHTGDGVPSGIVMQSSSEHAGCGLPGVIRVSQ